MQALHKVARDSLGKDRSNKDVDDWGNILWSKPVSPGVTSKRKAVVDEWEEKLIVADRKLARKRGWTALDSRILATTKIATPVRSRPQPLGSRTNLDESLVESYQLAASAQPPTPHTSPSRPAAPPSSASSPLAVEQEPVRKPPSTPVKHQDSISDILSGSLVFVATQNPISRRQWKLKIPSERIVHSLETLFIGCGWASEQAPNPHVQRGIIVLDDDEELAYRTDVLDAVKERKMLCSDLSNRKAIQVLERNTRRGSFV